jgi:hypothetical protein
MLIPNLHDCRPADDTGTLRPQELFLTAYIGVSTHVPEASLLNLLPETQVETIRKNRKSEDRFRRILARLLLGFGLSLLARLLMLRN